MCMRADDGQRRFSHLQDNSHKSLGKKLASLQWQTQDHSHISVLYVIVAYATSNIIQNECNIMM